MADSANSHGCASHPRPPVLVYPGADPRVGTHASGAHRGGRARPRPARLRAAALPRDGRVLQLRDLVLDHLGPDRRRPALRLRARLSASYLRLRRGTSGSGRAEGCGGGWRGQGLIAWVASTLAPNEGYAPGAIARGIETEGRRDDEAEVEIAEAEAAGGGDRREARAQVGGGVLGAVEEDGAGLRHGEATRAPGCRSRPRPRCRGRARSSRPWGRRRSRRRRRHSRGSHRRDQGTMRHRRLGGRW